MMRILSGGTRSGRGIFGSSMRIAPFERGFVDGAGLRELGGGWRCRDGVYALSLWI